ncbi:hypothetical protein [Synechococcus sp. 1G10]|uniref:hypothetical protein n=1 Tax=Synechococcus sp. 1G10 TaxID=2025605 RepID=UPI00117E4836|nr:hypothetical protein [Synechococcus sp. 1G10]
MPPPPEQSAANCSTPTYASDQLVCADPALLALDHRMVRLLAAASSSVPASLLHWFEPQAVWFRRRSRCAFSDRHAACLRAAYRERIEILSALAGRAASQWRPAALPVVCNTAPWGNGPVRLHSSHEGPLNIEDNRGTVLVVASSLQPRDDWTPFLRIVMENEGIRLEPLEGSAVRCRFLHDQPPGEVAPPGHPPQ